MSIVTRMRMRSLLKFSLALLLLQAHVTELYGLEATTESSLTEITTKKSGFFSGFKSFFGGGSKTTEAPVEVTSTTVKSVYGPIVLEPSKPKLPGITPSPPLQSSTPSTGYVNPNVKPGFGPLRPEPTLTHPSGQNVPFGAGTSYKQGQPTQPSSNPWLGLSEPGMRGPPLPNSRPSGHSSSSNPWIGFNQPNTTPKVGANGITSTTPTIKPPLLVPNAAPQPSPLPLSTTTTTLSPAAKPYENFPTLPKSPQQPLNPVLASISTTPKAPKINEDFPSLPNPKKPYIKEDFPALPTPKTPLPGNAHIGPSSTPPPSVWSTTKSPIAGTTNRVAFVPHQPSGSSSTVTPPKGSGGVGSLATDAELATLTETLFTKETSQIKNIRVNIQGMTRSSATTDEAPQPLLEVNDEALQSPTIAKMRLLFNNYELDTMINEYVTPLERTEENGFLDAIMPTPVMRQTMLFLQNKGVVTPDPKTHRDLVKKIWFTMYSRGGGKIGSSGFEHVFLSEVKNGTVIGLHDWVYFAEEEKAGHIDYKGYIKKLDLGNKGTILKYRLSHNGLNKPTNALFIGTSPELQIALYTLCFEVRPDMDCPVSLDGKKVNIVTHSWKYRGNTLIGSAYPEI